MKYFVINLFLLLGNLVFGMEVYESSNVVLHLNDDSTYRYYPKETSLKSLVTGNVVKKQDSLILTSHQMPGEAAIFAIFIKRNLSLELVYIQKEQQIFASNHLYLSIEEDPNDGLRREYNWTDYQNEHYSKFTFTKERYILEVENIENGKLEGVKFTFHPSPYSQLKELMAYKNGLKHGKTYYYEIANDEGSQVSLVKKEKYRKGILLKSKKLVTQPTFYTRHF